MVRIRRSPGNTSISKSMGNDRASVRSQVFLSQGVTGWINNKRPYNPLSNGLCPEGDPVAMFARESRFGQTAPARGELGFSYTSIACHPRQRPIMFEAMLTLRSRISRVLRIVRLYAIAQADQTSPSVSASFIRSRALRAGISRFTNHSAMPISTPPHA